MAYDTKQLHLLTDRMVADGMNVWTYDDTVDPSVVAASGYISDAMKQQGVSGRGLSVGDKVIYRRWTSLTSKIAANFVTHTEHIVTDVAAAGATLSLGGRSVIEDALAVTLTAAQSGGTFVFDKTDGVTVTLPAPQIGLEFSFVVDTVSASVGDKIITDAATTFIKGALVGCVLATPALAADVANGTTHRSINLDGTTKGGIAGTWFKLVCRSATVWEIVAGFNIKSGSVATPFATS